MRKSVALAVLFAVALAGCSHRVAFITQPPGAKVYVDGVLIGVSPTSFLEKSAFRKEYSVKVEKEGYKPLVRSERQVINGLYALLSFLTGCVGLLWSYTLEDEYVYTLERDQ